MKALEQAMAQPARSESEKILKELTLRFGDKDYTVPVLRMREAAKWRQEYFNRTKDVSDKMHQDVEKKAVSATDLKDSVRQALFGAMLEFPDKIPELVFSYAPSLKEKEEEIMAEAYDQDWERAFNQVWQVAFRPFLASLGMMYELQKSQVSPSPSRGASN